MKTPKRTIIAICQTKQTAGRLTLTLVFFLRPKKPHMASQQFPMAPTPCCCCSSSSLAEAPLWLAVTSQRMLHLYVRVHMDLWRGCALTLHSQAVGGRMSGVCQVNPTFLLDSPCVSAKPTGEKHVSKLEDNQGFHNQIDENLINRITTCCNWRWQDGLEKRDLSISQ